MLLVANLAKYKMRQKPEKLLELCNMGTDTKVLGESYPMNTNMTVLVLRMKVGSVKDILS